MTELPSFYFRRNIHVTFIEEDYAIRLLRDRIGVTNLMWSTDYPHPVCSWPDSRKIAAEAKRVQTGAKRQIGVSGIVRHVAGTSCLHPRAGPKLPL